MADHMRAQIRAGFEACITGLATTGGNVFSARVHKLPEASLPALRLRTGNELIRATSMGGGAAQRYCERILRLIVQIVQQSENPDEDQLDQILKEIEQAVAADQSLGVGAKWVQLAEVGEPEHSEESGNPVSVTEVFFDVLYIVQLDAPDVAR